MIEGLIREAATFFLFLYLIVHFKKDSKKILKNWKNPVAWVHTLMVGMIVLGSLKLSLTYFAMAFTEPTGFLVDTVVLLFMGVATIAIPKLTEEIVRRLRVKQ